MSAPAWIEPFLTWLTSNPITTTALRRIEGNTKHLRDGDTVFSGTKQFTNNVEMLSQLIVRAETILREIVQISGTLQVLGDTTINPRPGFGGTGNLSIGSGNITVGGNVSATAVNTGQGNNQLYAMDQNVRTTDDVTFPTVYPTTLGTRVVTQFTLTPGTNQIIPAGLWYIVVTTNAAALGGLEIQDSANVWQTVFRTSLQNQILGGLAISDGVNARVFNAISPTENVIFRRIQIF